MPDNHSFRKAKETLDKVIAKSRTSFYKPIQIAEILYHCRVVKDVDPLNVEDYRVKSRQWRDDMTMALVGNKCSSSIDYQDAIFDSDKISSSCILQLSQENQRTNGAVEAYIYERFHRKRDQLENAISICRNASKENFNVESFINAFWNEPGLRRSLDKVYEIVVYALFSSLVKVLDFKVDLFVDADKINILEEFQEFSQKVMGLDIHTQKITQNARIFRIGVTNAADRGLDMYSNWGPAIQVKHLSLKIDLAESIVGNVNSDRIVIVCKDAEESIILSLLNQIGWRSRIQSVITESELVEWYEKALRGQYANELGDKLLEVMVDELSMEFPSANSYPMVLKNRGYESLAKPTWWIE